MALCLGRSNEKETVERLTLVLGYVIVGLWVSSTVASFIDHSWSPPAEMHIALVALVTALFGKRFLDRKGQE